MKKDNTITVFYDEVTQRDIYRLNGVDVTDTIEILKDKWERQILDTRCRLFQLDMTVQQRLQEQIAELEAKLAITEKALELACKELRDDSCMRCNSCNRLEMCDYVLSLYPTSYFIEEAKEMLKNE